MTFRNLITKHYVNLRGWSTNRKIVVIESDDWGSIRMASKKAFASLKEKGYPVHKSRYTSLDSLEQQEDLEALFEVLMRHKDKNGNHPVITACAVVANPDYERIKQSNFQKYYFETIEETYQRYGEANLLNVWKEVGVKKNLLYPQFHGREHLNPKKWLEYLNEDNQMEKDAFELKTILGFSGSKTKMKGGYLAAFEPISEKHKKEIEKITKEGLEIFEGIFGFRSVSFMPSQSKQFETLNGTLVENGVFYNQAGQSFEPIGAGNFKKRNKYWGHQDNFGMTYWRRNCTFEPSKDLNKDHVDSCLKEIEIAFRCGKPAVINSHRINYVSRLNEENREQTLEKLNYLLFQIIKKWPNVEFMNSEEMSGLINQKRNE